MSFSGISRAKPSIMATESSEPDMIRSRSLSSSSSCVGKATNLPADAADADAGDRPAERQRRNEQGRGDAVHGDHVGVVLLVAGQHDRLALHFVAESPWETAAGSAGRRAAR